MAEVHTIAVMGAGLLVDLVGLDTRLHILECLHESLGNKYRPCPLMSQSDCIPDVAEKCGTVQAGQEVRSFGLPRGRSMRVQPSGWASTLRA